MRCLYREKMYICGDYADVQIYPVFVDKKIKHRGKRAKPTSETQERLNADNAARMLTRLLNTNFTPADYALHLTYKEQPQDADEAMRNVQNYLRRLRRLYTKRGITLKYVWVTEAGKKSGRIHHHLVISGGVDRNTIENMWGKGRANSRALQFDENGLAGLSNYIVKEPLTSKRWSCSRNLDKPEVRQTDYKITQRQAHELIRDADNREPFEALYPDYFVSQVETYNNEINRGAYLFIRLYSKGGGV